MSFAREFTGFLRRNGLKPILFHLLELYVGWLIRWLPGPEGLVLRGLFYRLLFQKCGGGLLLYPNVYIIFSHQIRAGKRVAVNVGTYIDARGGLELGEGVMVGPNCILATAGHSFERTDIPMYQQPPTAEKIVIEDDVWLGGNVCVRGGVRIGRGSVIAANSVVTKDIPPYSIAGGVPAKVLSSRKGNA